MSVWSAKVSLLACRFAFVYYEDERDAEKAVRGLDGCVNSASSFESLTHMLDGKTDYFSVLNCTIAQAASAYCNFLEPTVETFVILMPFCIRQLETLIVI